MSRLDNFLLKVFIIFAENGYKLLEVMMDKLCQLKGFLNFLLFTVEDFINFSPLSFNTYESIVR